MNYKTFILVCLTINSAVYSMQETSCALSVYAIPGKNGLGSSPGYIKDVIGRNVNVIKVDFPRGAFRSDLGQSACMKHLDHALTTQGEEGIIHASSQGTATALNYLADNPTKQVKALVLEAVLASGNSAILHTVTGPLMNLELLQRIPFSYYWVPYAAKVLFPFYWPAGKQSIKAIKKIDNTMPVVIVHAKDDSQLSYKDACALYYGLRMQGNDNAYFVSKEWGGHLDLLDGNRYDQSILPTILQRYDLLEQSQTDDFCLREIVDLKDFQPDPMQFKKEYDDLMFKENVHHYGGRLFGLGLVFVCLNFMKNVFWSDSPWKELADASFDNFIKNQTRL